MTLWLIYHALTLFWELLQHLPWPVKLWVILHFDYILGGLWSCSVCFLYCSLLPDEK